MPDVRLSLHLVSDATGETLNAIARATVVQFDHAHIVCHRWSLIRSGMQLHRVVEGIEAEPGPVLSTLLEQALRAELETACQRLGVPVLHILDPVLAMLADQVGEQAAARPGRQYALDSDYFRRIDAMHYVLSHDDGQAIAGIAEADLVLVGVSRSSKTPTSFYLANRGMKAANVPLVPGLPLPATLEAAQCPVIGLTLEVDRLVDIRRHRLHVISGGEGGEASPARGGDYVDPEAVAAELLWARRLCARHGWPMIDVTRRSIEETAAAVIQHSEAWHARHDPGAAGRSKAPDAPAA